MMAQPREKRKKTAKTRSGCFHSTTHLFKKVEVDTISLFLSDKKVTLFETGRDSSDIHWDRTFSCVNNFVVHGLLLGRIRKKVYKLHVHLCGMLHCTLVGELVMRMMAAFG
jgi:hypothetical protein